MQVLGFPLDQICCHNFQTWILAEAQSGKVHIAKVIQSAWESQTPVVSHSHLCIL